MFMSTQNNPKSFQAILRKIEDSISNYLRLKTYVSLLTGVLSYFVLLLVGVDGAPFWAFLIFLLNYIPTIGSLVATEPKVFGKSLNLSPLVTILSLAVWGEIWGITGMILSVPITVIMIIIFSQFDKTKNIAILLSESGNVDEI